MAPRELAFAGNKDEDVKAFFFKNALFEFNGKIDENSAQGLFRYLKKEALNFYTEMLCATRALFAEYQSQKSMQDIILLSAQSSLNNLILDRLGKRCPLTAFTNLTTGGPHNLINLYLTHLFN